MHLGLVMYQKQYRIPRNDELALSNCVTAYHCNGEYVSSCPFTDFIDDPTSFETGMDSAYCVVLESD